MACKSCGSSTQQQFIGEIAIHVPGLEGQDKPPVFVFPRPFICLNCGNAEFVVPEPELSELAKGKAAGAE